VQLHCTNVAGLKRIRVSIRRPSYEERLIRQCIWNFKPSQPPVNFLNKVRLMRQNTRKPFPLTSDIPSDDGGGRTPMKP
jgi:hypothetical protein